VEGHGIRFGFAVQFCGKTYEPIGMAQGFALAVFAVVHATLRLRLRRVKWAASM
jgi:hypothetical protein